MSDAIMETRITYAIKDGRPPETWHSEWTFFNGVRVVGGNLPNGFVQVAESDYLEAIRAQTASADRGIEQGVQAERQSLSSQRKALVETGMTLEQAQILLPDPLGDYAIDEL